MAIRHKQRGEHFSFFPSALIQTRVAPIAPYGDLRENHATKVHFIPSGKGREEKRNEMTGMHGCLRLIFIYFPDKQGRDAFSGRFLSSHSSRIIHGDGTESRQSSREGKRNERMEPRDVNEQTAKAVLE
jgi:hypothetical protein